MLAVILARCAMFGLLVPLVPAQSGGCNGNTRTPVIAAGYQNEHAWDARPLQLTVAGRKYGSPADEPMSFVYYAGTVWTCGPAQAELDCDPTAGRVRFVLAVESNCPNYSGLALDAPYASWSDVPAAISTTLRCRVPKLMTKWDDSARVFDCADSRPPAYAFGTTQLGGDVYTVAPADPSPFLSGPPADPFGDSFSTAQSRSLAMLAEPLRAAVASSAPIAAARLTADVTVEHFESEDSLGYRNSYRVDGLVLGDGRFDVTLTQSLDEQVFAERLVYTGNALIDLERDAETGNAYGLGYRKFGRTFDVLAFPMRSVVEWLRDPYQVARFDDAAYVELANSEAGRASVVRRLSRPDGAFDAEKYELNTQSRPAAVVAAQQFDELRLPRVLSTFADHRSVAPGTLRPFKTTKTVFRDVPARTRRVVVTLEVREATSVAPTEFAEPRFPSSSVFFVWN